MNQTRKIGHATTRRETTVQVFLDNLRRQQQRQTVVPSLEVSMGTDDKALWKGRYALHEVVGAGGMGTVFRASDMLLRRDVAVKFLRRQEPRWRRRAVREARAMAQLDHPNIASIYDVIADGDDVALIMQFVRGPALTDALASKKLHWKAILRLFIDAARGLGAAHELGIVHRDFKPGNVLVSESNRALVTDFGLACAQATTDAQTDAGLARSITEQGFVLGTLRYMAPEQARGAEPNAKADQYSFCVALWEALVGQTPFASTEARNAASIAERRVPQTPARSKAPRRVLRVLRRGLEFSPEDRWPSMAMLESALASALRPARSRPLWGLAVAATCAIAGAGVYVNADSQTSCSQSLQSEWTDGESSLIDAFVTSGRPYGPKAALRSSEQLRRFSQSWDGAYQRICDVDGSGRIEVPLSSSVACLTNARSEFREALRYFVEDPTDAVEHADAVIRGLPDPTACIRSFSQQVGLGSSSTPTRLQRDAARLATSQAAVALRAGDIGVAQARLSQAREFIDGLPLAVEHVELARLEGKTARAQGDLDIAKVAFLEAFSGATSLGERRLAIEALIGLADIEGGRKQNAAYGEAYVAQARALLPEGAPVELRSALTSVEARICRARGQYQCAVERGREVVAMWSAHAGEESLEAATARVQLADSLAESGELETAAALLRGAEAVMAKGLHVTHPRWGHVQNSLGVVYARDGKFDLASASFESARATFESAYPDGNAVLIDVYANLGNIALSQGKPAEAAESLGKAVEMAREANPVAAAKFQVSWARALADSGRGERGRVEARHAVDTLRKLASTNPVTAWAEQSLAALESELGDTAQAGELAVLAWNRARSVDMSDRLAADFALSVVQYAKDDPVWEECVDFVRRVAKTSDDQALGADLDRMLDSNQN